MTRKIDPATIAVRAAIVRHRRKGSRSLPHKAKREWVSPQRGVRDEAWVDKEGTVDNRMAVNGNSPIKGAGRS